ncbi:MAG: hypothetical protein ACTTH8_06895 [Treponema sp.]
MKKEKEWERSVFKAGEVSLNKSLRHGRCRIKMISDVLRNAKLTPIILHGCKMIGNASASCLNLPKCFGSLYLEPYCFLPLIHNYHTIKKYLQYKIIGDILVTSSTVPAITRSVL